MDLIQILEIEPETLYRWFSVHISWTISARERKRSEAFYVWCYENLMGQETLIEKVIASVITGRQIQSGRIKMFGHKFSQDSLMTSIIDGYINKIK